MSAAGLIYLVDDDESVRQALARLIRSAGMRAEVFETVPDLVGQASNKAPDCVIADIRMPEISGLELPHMVFAMTGRAKRSNDRCVGILVC
jgi:FixJ family two-component response regulator